MKKLPKNAAPKQAEIVIVRTDQKSLASLAGSGDVLSKQLSIKITTQAELDTAAALLRAAEAWRAQVMVHTAPVKKATDEAHKAAVKMEKDMLARLNGPIDSLRAAMSKFIAGRTAKEQQRQLEADNAQRAKNQEIADQQAKLAKKAGADKETINSIVEEILATPAPAVRTGFTMPAGTSSRKTYDVDRESFDLYKLCCAVANSPREENIYLPLVVPNWQAIKNRFIEAKGKANVPGFTGTENNGVAIKK